MTDAEIETHLRGMVRAAYPDVSDNEVLIAFISGAWNDTARRHGTQTAAGEETVEVHAVLFTEKKIDRHEMIRRSGVQRIGVGADSAVMRFVRWTSGDYIEVAKVKQVSFVYSVTQNVWK